MGSGHRPWRRAALTTGDGAHDVSGRDRPRGGLHADAGVVVDLDPGDRDALMDVDPMTDGGLREPPDDRVVSSERAGRVVRRAENRQLAAAAQVHQRTHPNISSGPRMSVCTPSARFRADFSRSTAGSPPCDRDRALLGAELDVESELRDRRR